jgi:hypothetical protein
MSDNARLLADFLPRREAAVELDVCERTLDRWRRLGDGPPVTKIGRRVYYRRQTLLAWLGAREQQGSDVRTPRAPSARGNDRSSPALRSGRSCWTGKVH